MVVVTTRKKQIEIFSYLYMYATDCLLQIVKQHQLTSTQKPPACILDVTEKGIRITEHPLAQGQVLHLAQCTALHNTPNWKNVVVYKAYTMNDTTQWFSGKRKNLLLFSGTVKMILIQDTQIYSKTVLAMKISWISIYRTEYQACRCCLPKFLSCRIVHGLCFAPDNVLSIRCICCGSILSLV